MPDRTAAAPSFLSLTPPGGPASERLDRVVARITTRRVRRLGRRLAALPKGRRLARLVAATGAILREISPGQRGRLLHGPDLRGFLSEAEGWTEILALTALASRAGVSGTAARDRLFDRVSRTEHLATLVPRGRLDAGFPARARRFAGARLAALETDAAAFLLGARLASGAGEGGPALRLAAGAEPEQGRPAHRIDLGMFGGPAGALALELRGGRPGMPLTATLAHGTLVVSGRYIVAVFPAAGSPLRFPAGAAPSDSGAVRLVRRPLIPGTSILLAPSVESSARRLKVGRDIAGLDRRLERALRLVRLAWPDGHREVLARTAMVVPVREPGLVSYSLAARPGVSFINVHGKSTLQLADDLLHETAHHLLHDVQETADLLVRGPETEEIQAFDSPWRGTRRPLHGLLHGAYTFHFRAELFTRLLETRRRLPRLIGPLLGRGGAGFVRRELGRELAMIRRALDDLHAASRFGLLTPAGRALLRALEAWRRRLTIRMRRL
jgi:hypothetical protein